MSKRKIFRIIIALSLALSLLISCSVYASAKTESLTTSAVPREFKDFAAATVDRGVDYNLSSLDLSTLPKYMEESLGFDELEKGKKPISVTDLNVEDLYSFTTYNEDDTLTLYRFSEPVKFVDKSTEAIRFVDNTIKVASAEKQPPVISGQSELYTAKSYTNTANFFSVNMPASVNQGISLKLDNLTFSLTPAKASLSTASLKTSNHRGMSEEVVEYRNALGDGVHLQYVPISSGVKENIILDRYPGTNKFEFIVDVGNYYPVYTEGESIPFADPATDEISIILGQADARDSYTGEETDGHFTLYNSLEVKELEDGRYALTVTIDQDFLTSPDTVYPVVIDPSYTLPSTSFRDTTVYSGVPNSSAYYTSAYMCVGNHGSSYGEGIAFVQTKKMTDLINNGIAPEKVNFAHYRVYEGSGKTNHSMIRLYGTTANWDQTTITYNNKPDYDSGSIASQVVDHSGWYTFDVTRHVKNFLAWAKNYSGYSQTRGFALAATDPTASSKHFCSGEYTGSTKPSIIINYASSTYDINDSFRNRNGQLQTFLAWGKLINGSAPMFKFTVNTAGRYIMETISSDAFYSESHTQTDTMIALFDSNLSRLALNDDGSNTTFSKIQRELSVGTYYLAVSDAVDSDGAAGTGDSVGVVENIKCYLAIYKTNELIDSQYWANCANEYYKIPDPAPNETYNCMGYAIGVYDDADLGSDSLTNIRSEMASYGWSERNWNTNTDLSSLNECVIAYGGGDSIIHFAKYENGIITAKMDGYEVVQHTGVYAYHHQSYDTPYKYFVKN